MMPGEIHAVIDAAHRFGVKVTAHSGSPVATSIAVDYGLDCVEHGYFLDRPTLKKMKEHGTWLVPTIVVSQPASAPFFERIGSPPMVPETARFRRQGPLAGAGDGYRGRREYRPGHRPDARRTQ